MTEFVHVASLDQCKEGTIFGVQVNGRYLALYLIKDQVYCTEDVCTHEFTALSDGGFIDGFEVECAEHGARFNIETGEVTRAPAYSPIECYPVEVRDGQVFVGFK
jgi:nitrite reductase/ring-hydroxylating ferredoxin subunit